MLRMHVQELAEPIILMVLVNGEIVDLYIPPKAHTVEVPLSGLVTKVEAENMVKAFENLTNGWITSWSIDETDLLPPIPF